MAGRFLDFMAQGADADLPVAATMAAKIVPGSAAIYYANDSQKWYFYNENTVAWDPLDLTVLTGLLSDLGDVDFSVAPTDGQMLAYDFATSKWKPMDVPAGYDDSMADARIAAASVGDLSDVDLSTPATNGQALIWDTDHFEPQSIPAGYTDEQARDAIGAALTAGTGVTVTVNDGADTITLTLDGEVVRDLIASFVTAGTGITVTHNDGADTLTIDSTITQYTDEMARDVIGAALVAGTGVTITVNDGADTITIAATGGSSGILWAVDATGTGASQGITMPASVANAQDVLVFVNGIRWKASEYSVSTTTLTITSNASGDNIQIIGIATGGLTSLSIDALNDVDTTTAAPATGDLLKWNGTVWVPTQPPELVLSEQDVSAVATVNFTQFASKWRHYRLEFSDVFLSVAGNSLGLRVSTDGGSSYDTGANYDLTHQQYGSGGFTNLASAEAATYWDILANIIASNQAAGSGIVHLMNPQGSGYKGMLGRSFSWASDAHGYGHDVAGRWRNTSAYNAIRLHSTGGNISGKFRLIGIK